MKTAFISVTVIALIISTLSLLAADASHSMNAIQQQVVSKEREELDSLTRLATWNDSPICPQMMRCSWTRTVRPVKRK